MLNPSVVAVILGRSAFGFARESRSDMPWALSFVVAPLVLHRGTRAALPSRVSTHLPAWVSREPAVRAGFPLRAASLVGPVRAGLRFGLRHDMLSLNGALLGATQMRPPADEPELVELMTKATFVGRWLSKLERPSTAFALFGVSV